MDAQQWKKRNTCIVTALSLMALGWILPAPNGLSRGAVQVTGIFAGTLLLWLTVAIDWPSVLCLAMLFLVDGLKPDVVLKSSLGSSTFAFLLFTFLCTYALSKTEFVRRCAVFFILNPILGHSPRVILIRYLLCVLLLGLFMSPTVLFVLCLPIHEEICALLHLKKGDRLGTALMTGMAFCCALSSGMTPIGHVFPVMAMGFYETATKMTVSYGAYMAFALPIGFLCFLFLLGLIFWGLRPDLNAFSAFDGKRWARQPEAMSSREKKTVAVFFLVVALWLAPTFLKPLFPAFAKGLSELGTAFPPMVGAVLLLILTDLKQPLLTFSDGCAKGIGWGSMMMAASTLALGAAMTHADIGLTDYLSGRIANAVLGWEPMLLVFIFTLWAAVQTNVSSNMVTITVVCTAALPIVLASEGRISAPAVASLVGMMGAFAFATPPSHPNIALAAASGWVSTRQLLGYGLALMLFSVFVSVFFGYPLAQAMMGM
ncbi:MAG: anion permease [Ndongobacter sp.]|nr:anion permease [Ndongobacter sp.]